MAPRTTVLVFANVASKHCHKNPERKWNSNDVWTDETFATVVDLISIIYSLQSISSFACSVYSLSLCLEVQQAGLRQVLDVAFLLDCLNRWIINHFLFCRVNISSFTKHAPVVTGFLPGSLLCRQIEEG
jgi:hypothetical protein